MARHWRVPADSFRFPLLLSANVYAEQFLLTARTEATDCVLIFSERHAGLGVCARKPHGSCGLVHGVYKDRKSSFRYGV